MTIERIHIENGYPIDQTNSHDIAKRAIVANINSLRSLPEGEYDLTPNSSEYHSFEHNLVVFGDGRGMYRGIPSDQNIGTIEYSPDGKTNSRLGGRIIRIPEDTCIALISSPTKDKKLGIYEIIFYLPGPSPKPNL